MIVETGTHAMLDRHLAGAVQGVLQRAVAIVGECIAG